MKLDFRSIFILISIFFLSFMVSFYGSRLIYYYKIEHKKSTKNYISVEYIWKKKNQ
jgi:hypothetical protein